MLEEISKLFSVISSNEFVKQAEKHPDKNFVHGCGGWCDHAIRYLNLRIDVEESETSKFIQYGKNLIQEAAKHS